MKNDLQLLREYNTDGSEEAFAELVSRHVDMVYGAALRQTRDPNLAEEITQVVFVILARRAKSFNEKIILAGWLYRTTRFAANNALRNDANRRRREQEAYMETVSDDNSSENNEELAASLDEAMAKLGDTDRDAIVLRFFKGKSIEEVGVALRVGEKAAQKRVLRAVEKLRKFYLKRGATLSAVAITTAITATSAHAAPMGLAATVTGAAIKGATAPVSTFVLLKGTLKLMAWTKMKLAAVVGVSVLLAVGATTAVIVQKSRSNPDIVSPDIEAILADLYSANLSKAPECIMVRPTRFPAPGYTSKADLRKAYSQVPGAKVPANSNPVHPQLSSRTEGDKIAGHHLDLMSMMIVAHDFHRTRTIMPRGWNTNYYDFLVTIPDQPREKFQAAIRDQFGYVGRFQAIETNVLLMKLGVDGANKLQLAGTPKKDLRVPNGGTIFFNWRMSDLLKWVQNSFDLPIVDDTGLTNRYDIVLNVSGGTATREEYKAKMQQALREQLGLELVPAVHPADFLFVEKVKK